MAYGIAVGRTYGASLFGILTIGWILAQGAAIVLRGAYDVSLIRFVSAAEVHQDSTVSPALLQHAVHVVVRRAIAASLAAILLLWTAATVGGPVLGIVIYGSMAVLLPLFVVVPVLSGYLRATRRPIFACLFDVGFIPLVGVPVVLLGPKSIVMPVIALMVGGVVGMVLTFRTYTVLRHPEALVLSRKLRNEFRGMAKTMLSAQAINFTNQWALNALMGVLVSAHAVGLYSAAARVAQIPNLILQSLSIFFAPSYASAHASRDRKGLRLAWRRSLWWAFGATLPCTIAGIIWAEQVLSIFGAEFAGAVLVLRILLVAQFAAACSGGALMVLNMSGDHSISRNILAGGFAVTVVAGATALPILGIEGAAIATLLTMTVQTALGVWVVLNRTRPNPALRSIAETGSG